MWECAADNPQQEFSGTAAAVVAVVLAVLDDVPGELGHRKKVAGTEAHRRPRHPQWECSAAATTTVLL